LVFNHIDRVSDPAVLEGFAHVLQGKGFGAAYTDAKGGRGLPALTALISERLTGEEPGEAALVIGSQRQRDLLFTVSRHAHLAAQAVGSDAGIAVAAEEVIHALDRLSELDGRETREGVLDRLFARFCIGK
jgi:tRNA modification GTPase